MRRRGLQIPARQFFVVAGARQFHQVLAVDLEQGVVGQVCILAPEIFRTDFHRRASRLRLSAFQVYHDAASGATIELPCCAFGF